MVSAEDLVNNRITNPFETLVSEEEMAQTAETSPLPILARTSRVALNLEHNIQRVNNPETHDRNTERDASLYSSSNLQLETEGEPRLRVLPVSQTQ